MWAVSMPMPFSAARASPDSFRRMRLKTGVGIGKQVLRFAQDDKFCFERELLITRFFVTRLFSTSAYRKHKSKGAPKRPFNYLAAGSAASVSSGFVVVNATVPVASRPLKRAKRRTEMFSPSLPIFAAINCE